MTDMRMSFMHNNLFGILQIISIGLGLLFMTVSLIIKLRVRREDELQFDELQDDFIITVSVIHSSSDN